jgi:cell division protein DivIC
MKLFSSIFSVLKNKYLLALLVFAFVMFFFDQNDIFVQMDRSDQLSVLQAKKKFYQNEIAKTQKELSDLQNNPAAIEKYARENFYMKKPNEDLFLVVNAADSAK